MDTRARIRCRVFPGTWINIYVDHGASYGQVINRLSRELDQLPEFWNTCPEGSAGWNVLVGTAVFNDPGTVFDDPYTKFTMTLPVRTA